MARKVVQENSHKLTSKDNTEFYKLISPDEEIENKDKNDKQRNTQKKWTITTKNIFMSQKKHKTKFNSRKDIKNIYNNNPLMKLQISSIKQEEEKKPDNNISSFKNNLINNINIMENQNVNEKNKSGQVISKKENKILIIKSEETSNSATENNDNSSVSKKAKKEKEKRNNSKVENNKNSQELKAIKENAQKELASPRRKSVQLVMHFSAKKMDNDENDKSEEQSNSRSKSSKSKNSSIIKKKDETNIFLEKLNDKLNSSRLLKELSKDEENVLKIPNANQGSYQRIKNEKYSTGTKYISPFINESEFKIFSKKKPKNVIKLQKYNLKNMIIYKPKWTPKQFYEHEIFLQKRKERINNSKKAKQIQAESRKYQSIPTINPVSIEILNQTESYVPIMKRSIEYKNQKRYKDILNEKIKEREIDELIKSNNMYTLDKTQADVLYWRQKFWKKKVEDKLNKSSYKKQKLKEKEEENKYLNYKLQLNSRNYSYIETRSKYFHTTINDNNINYNTKTKKNINVFERLYRDNKTHEKKIKEITKNYFNTLFKPNINHSFILSKKNVKKTKSQNYIKTTNYKKNTIYNLNKYISKNNKKTFSLIVEDINVQKNKSRNKKIKNEILTSIDSTKTSKNTNNAINQRLSFEFEKIKNIKKKINPITNKEITPIPIKLGEIKEADSVMSESTRRKKIKANKNNDNKANLNNSQNKSHNSNDNNNISINFNSDKLIKKSFHKKREGNIKENFKEQSSSPERVDSQLSNDTNKIKIIRKSSSTVRPSNFKNLIKEHKINIINDSDANKSKKYFEEEKKIEVSFIQENNEINNKKGLNNNINSPSFNSLIKKEKNAIKNNSKEENLTSENILQESGSFGNYQYSNLLSKDILQENQEKEPKRQKSKKIKNIERKSIKNKNINDLKEEELLSKYNIKKIADYNFNPFENQNSKDDDSISSEETSSIKEQDDIIQKIRNIEMKEERNKIDKMIEGKKNKKNKKDKKNKEIELYMINWGNNLANATKQPFIYTDKKGIFYDFFKKN